MRLLEDTPPGCWVLKGDPKVWNYFSFLHNEQVQVGKPRTWSWTLQSNYRSDMMQVDDLAVLWITGATNPGIYEIGKLVGRAEPVSGMDPEYAVDQDKARKADLSIPFETILLAPPVARHELEARKTLAECEPFRSPRGSNPSFLTITETSALTRLLAGRAPTEALRKLGWNGSETDRRPSLRRQAPS